jgi:hypothetical protein
MLVVDLATPGKAAKHTYTGSILTKEVFGSEVVISDGKFTCSAICLSTELNKDGTVNILDITMVAAIYNSKEGDPKWNELADLDKSGLVNILDISMVAKDFGKTVWSNPRASKLDNND